jgi:MarR family 2-MHQ and catechol resistance regulon transcriptional repressor
MGTHYQGPEAERRALSAFINLMRAAETLSAALSRRVAAEGLSLRQFGVLEALHHLGPLPHCELGRKLLKTSGDITMVVTNLEKRGLVERQRDEGDRRVVTVHLTGEGRALIERMFPGHAAGITDDLSPLTPEEQETLRRLCRKLGKREEE